MRTDLPDCLRLPSIANMLTAVTDSPAERLGRHVKDRRLQLGLTHSQLNAAGGPSPGTLQKIENGRAETLTGNTTAGLERALRWSAGSVQAVLDGRKPTSAGAVVEREADSSGRPVTVTVDVGAELSEIERRELMVAAEAEILRRYREIRNPE